MDVTTLENKYTVEDSGPCKKKISVEIPKETIKTAYENNLKDILSNAQVKGFRKGKVPRSMLEKKYQKDILEEVKLNSLREAFKEVMEQKQLKPVSEPELQTENISIQIDSPLHFEFSVEVEPEFELKEYKGTEVELESEKITEETLNFNLKSYQKRHGTLEEKAEQVVAPHDEVTLKLRIECEGVTVFERENYPYSWGGTQLYLVKVGKNFSSALTGMKVGEEKNIPVSIPEFLLHAHHDLFHKLTDSLENLNTQDLTFPATLFFTVTKVSVLKAPELTDEWLQEHEKMSLADFRKSTQEELEKQKENHLRSLAGTAVLEKIAKDYDFEVPLGVLHQSLLNRYTHHDLGHLLEEEPELFEGKNKEEIQKILLERFEPFKQKYLKSAHFEYRKQLLLERIAKKERIYVTEQELEVHVRRLAQLQQASFDEFYSKLENEGELDSIRLKIKSGKTLEFLANHAKIKEVYPEEPS